MALRRLLMLQKSPQKWLGFLANHPALFNFARPSLHHNDSIAIRQRELQHITDKVSADLALSLAVNKICNWKKGHNREVYSWALEIQDRLPALQRSEAAKLFWERQGAFQIEERATLAQHSAYNRARMSLYSRDSNQETTVPESSKRGGDEVASNLTEPPQKKRSTDDKKVELGDAWARFVETVDPKSFHHYRLERNGILQIGRTLQPVPDIPPTVYEAAKFHPRSAPFPAGKFKAYLNALFSSDTYGTLLGGTKIFSTTYVQQQDLESWSFLAQMLYIFSNDIHSKENPSDLTKSETSYCHFALWPMIRAAIKCIQGMECIFRLGETPLSCIKTDKKYNADGAVYCKQTNLEVLILEASGSLGTRDKNRHAFDHIKAAFGCHAMINAILEKYPYAHPSLLEDVQVLFIHSSAKDDAIRLWIMKPAADGRILSFERFEKTEIKKDATDLRSLMHVIDFFWVVKEQIQKATDAIQSLRQSHERKILEFGNLDEMTTITELLTPKPIKPSKHSTCRGLADLDPVSFFE